MGWKIIEIEQKSILKAFNNNLVIFDVTKKIVPMSDIDVLIISNNHISITINTINELISNGVCLIFCNDKKLPHSLTLGYKVQKQSYINFEKQMNWTKQYKEKCWNWILNYKINHQLKLLDFYSLNTQKWKSQFINCKNLSNSMLEANISNFFFKQLYKSNFKRNQTNLVNDILNYGYTVITNMVARSLAKKGLNLNISFYHGSIYSPFPLAYDIVELFRIIIDLFTVKLFYDWKLNYKDEFDRKIKSCLLDFIANFKICIDGKFEFINNSIDKVIDWLLKDEFEQHKIEYNYEIKIINYQEEMLIHEQNKLSEEPKN